MLTHADPCLPTPNDAGQRDVMIWHTPDKTAVGDFHGKVREASLGDRERGDRARQQNEAIARLGRKGEEVELGNRARQYCKAMVRGDRGEAID